VCIRISPSKAVDGGADNSSRLSHHFHPPAIARAFASTLLE